MPRPLYRPPRLRRAFFRGSDALQTGLLTPDQLRTNAWRKVFRDVYVDSSVPESYELRCRAVRLLLPEGAAVTGRSAACLDGVPIGEPNDLVQVIAPSGTRWARRGCTLTRTSWLPAEHVVPGVVPRTIPLRTAWEIASGPNLVEAVVDLDVVFRSGRPSREALDAWVGANPESQAALAIGLADPLAESPQESRTRVRLVLAGFPPPTSQHELWFEGRFVARFDLSWLAAKVAVEYDGMWHGEGGQISKDRARLNRINEAGWEVLFVTRDQLREPELFALFCDQLRRALARRGVACSK
ncbi:endonuclease domain-containing protein [Cryptosporangium sp. NPDC048952]|uniref:endonuclease domain-containing protein n=1 Tax=Cryptosporangium sp. NPDC048952 TaxID=3363961 RepID=UPI0037185B68